MSCLYRLIAFCLTILMVSSCQKVDFSDNGFVPLPSQSNTDDQKRLTFLTELLNEDSNEPTYYYQRAKLNYKLERYRVGLRDIEACIKLDGEKAEYLYWKASMLSELNDYEQALLVANQAIAKGLSRTDMDILLGQLHYHNGNTADALQYLENAYKLAPDNANAAYYLGAIFDDRADSASAIRELQNAIRLKPSYTDAYLRVVDIYNDGGLHSLAGEYLQKALASCQSDAALFVEVGHWLWRDSQRDSSIYWYRRGLQMRPALWEANYQLAQYYIDKKDYVLAESYYKEALSYNPNIKDGYYQVGYIYEYYLNQLEEAKKAYQKALKLDQSKAKEITLIIQRIDKKIALQQKPRAGIGL